jgi:hypothetical protein
MTSPAPATPMASPAASATPIASPAPATPMASPAPAPANNVPPMQFGSPPSGRIPILFNDHHVYSRPDVDRQGRVLSALVRGGTLLVPLRSMFEQMGATVNYDPSTRTVDVKKTGAEVSVTVGKPEVTINGETRPLDVPPMMYHGEVLVPVRVISEAMGAYVLWVPDQRVVVVRYIPPTAPSSPPPAPPPPAPAPTVTPSPVPSPPYLDKFIAGDYIIDPTVYNEFSPGNKGKTGSYAVRGAIEFNVFNLPWMLEGDYRQWQYPHDCSTAAPAPSGDQCNVTTIGGLGSTYVPAFTAKDQDVDGRLGLRVASPRIYIGVGYLWREGNYGYPREQGVGFGLEKLPDLDHTFSLYGSAYYYPNVSGTCGVDVCPTGPFTLAYRVLRYQIGATVNFGTPTGVFLDFGWLGDQGRNRLNAPADYTHNGPYVGLGIHF